MTRRPHHLRALCLALALALAPPAEGQAPPRFEGTVSAVRGAALRASWRAGCPVPRAWLRLVTARHWGMDGAVHAGAIVVHADHARGVLRVLRALFDARFPIERMEPIDAYGGDDHRSMAANNTSGFNCREVAGRPGVWSEHAYGRAIDLNPVQNPYVEGALVSPPAGARYTDRRRPAPGLVTDGDVVVRAFAAIGWRWGGRWRTKRDYQHFSATGR